MKLEGKVAVVTGGARGIGEGICREFAKEGAQVVVLDLDEAVARGMASELGEKSLSFSCNVAKKDEVESVVAAIHASCKKIDIWVNNAGVSYIVPSLECTEATWRKTIDINLTGTFWCCQAATKIMSEQKSGVILNMSSQSGKTGNSHYAAYCASKFGIIGLTQSLAVEFASHGIRVNTLCPGVVFTPLWNDMISDYAAKRDMQINEVKPYLESKIPLGRLGKTTDIAKLAVFLASDDATYITGQAINVSGGAVMH